MRENIPRSYNVVCWVGGEKNHGTGAVDLAYYNLPSGKIQKLILIKRTGKLHTGVATQRLERSVGYYIDSWCWLLHNDIIQRSLIQYKWRPTCAT
jgi:hypothetical protein